MHIGIIPDGTRRYAKKAGITLPEAYAISTNKLKEVIGWFVESGFDSATVYVFSVDNFKRPADQVQMFFDLLIEKFRELVLSGELLNYDITIKFIGDLSLLPTDEHRSLLRQLEMSTVGSKTVYFAIGYGGRQEIVDAVNRLIADGAHYVDEALLDSYMYISSSNDLDLIIRTSGERRTSGFMLWKAAYAEYAFPECLFIDFTKEEFLQIVKDFKSRDRRFGK